MMAWSGEVLGHALILTCPLAACYTARLLARLTAELDATSRGISVRAPFARRGTFTLPSARIIHETGQCLSTGRLGCFQYNNAAFSYESNEEDFENAAPGTEEEDEVDFCIMTPQQAFGVLGDHAPQYTKIFVNGSTFVADRSEPGTVISVEEYANRMQGSSAFSIQSTGGSPAGISPSVGDTSEINSQVDSASVRSTDGGVSVSMSQLSCCSNRFSETSLSSYDNVVSQRSSFDMPALSNSCSTQLPSCDRMSAPHAPLDGVVEGPYCCGTVPQTHPKDLHVSLDDVAQSDVWRAAAEAATAEAEAEELSAPCTPRERAAPSRPVISPQSTGDASTSAPASAQPRRVAHGSHSVVRDTAEPCAAVAKVKAPAARAGDLVRCGSHGGAVAGYPDKVGQRRWVPAGSRSMPPPLPAPGPRASAPQSSCSTSRSCHAQLQGGSNLERTWSSWESSSAPHSPQRPVSIRPRTCAGGAASAGAPGSPATSPVGLCRAPALPLPDGSSLETEVPPALRYYLAQARAAVTSSDVSGGSGLVTGAPLEECAMGSGGGRAADLGAGRRGFVRATVEQLNTQRLICCHVTPFAAAKTSRKPRPLARTGGAAAAVK